MSSGEKEVVNEAQGFCVRNHAWLVKTCSCRLQRKGILNHVTRAEDCTTEIYLRCGRITDAKWSEVRDPFRYVARMVINHVWDIAEPETPTEDELLHSLQRLARDDEPFTPAPQEFDLLLEEMLAQLNEDESWLFEMFFFERLETEAVAKRMGLSCAAVRKRLSRLREKMRTLNNEGTASPPRKADASAAGAHGATPEGKEKKR